VDPAKRTVTVRRPGARDEVLGQDDEVGGGDVLPGFTVTVREMFADLE
jgi:Uma2 family endonuclease